jgi:two-component system response regulator BaeR
MTTSAHILVVEDEPKIAALLRDYLVAAGWRVSTSDTGNGVAAWVREHAPDAVLLDLMLPGKDGIAVCRELRAFSNVPILMLTARVEEIDRVLGLELGADDYICKPFSPREVVARVRAILRRATPVGDAPAAAHVPAIDLDEDRFEARVAGRSLALTRVEFRLLRKLLEHPGRVFSRQQLLDSIYDDYRVVSDRTVDSHVKNLRRKLQRTGVDPIASVYGVGYRYESPERGE